MWIKQRWLMVISIKSAAQGKRFRLWLPMPLLIVTEIIDPIEELSFVLSNLLHRFLPSPHANPLQAIGFLQPLLRLVQDIRYIEPIDLVNVEAKDIKVKVSIC